MKSMIILKYFIADIRPISKVNVGSGQRHLVARKRSAVEGGESITWSSFCTQPSMIGLLLALGNHHHCASHLGGTCAGGRRA